MSRPRRQGAPSRVRISAELMENIEEYQNYYGFDTVIEAVNALLDDALVRFYESPEYTPPVEEVQHE